MRGEICPRLLSDDIAFQIKERCNRGADGSLVKFPAKQSGKFVFNAGDDPLRVAAVVLFKQFIIVLHHRVQFSGTGEDLASDVVVAMVGRRERLYVAVLLALKKQEIFFDGALVVKVIYIRHLIDPIDLFRRGRRRQNRLYGLYSP